MRISRMALLVAVFVLMGAMPSSASFTLKGGQLLYEQGGKQVVFKSDSVFVERVQGADMRFLILGEEEAKRIGKKTSLLIFDAAGALVKEIDSLGDIDVEQISVLFFSPGKSVLAVDSGTWLVRNWDFVSYPDLRPLGRLTYVSNGEEGHTNLAWVDDGRVLSTVLDEEGRKHADYDPGGIASVVLFDIKSGKQVPVFAGTVLCDYELSAFDGATVTAIKSCGQKPEDWATSDAKEKGVTSAKVTGPLPAGQ